MFKEIYFRIIVVGKEKGNGVELTETPDEVVHYKGQGVIVQLYGYRYTLHME
jgi:hypothetical protein